MDNESRSLLNDEQMLFTILTAIVKNNEGHILIVTDEQMDSVSKEDTLLMYYDNQSNQIILSMNVLSNDSNIH